MQVLPLTGKDTHFFVNDSCLWDGRERYETVQKIKATETSSISFYYVHVKYEIITKEQN